MKLVALHFSAMIAPVVSRFDRDKESGDSSEKRLPLPVELKEEPSLISSSSLLRRPPKSGKEKHTFRQEFRPPDNR